MVRQGHIIAAVETFLVGCIVLLVAGCAGVRSEAPQGEQGHTESTKQEQAHSGGATSEEARCEGTRVFDLFKRPGVDKILFGSISRYSPETRKYTTNDVPSCPDKGGLLSGTDEADKLAGEDGDDEIRGLGAKDVLIGGSGSDVIYGGDGDDSLAGGYIYVLGEVAVLGGPGNHDGGDDVLYGGPGNDRLFAADGGEDVLYGGDGNDTLNASGDRQRDKLYCGEGKDYYTANKLTHVDSSCEVKDPPSSL